MNTVGSADMPLLSELIETCKQVGPEATIKALANARNATAPIIKDDPISEMVINAVLTEMAINYEQLTSYKNMGIKKQHGLIIASYCLIKLKYEYNHIGVMLGGRERTAIWRYSKKMEKAKTGRLAQYRAQFDILIKTLSKKIKKGKNGNRKR